MSSTINLLPCPFCNNAEIAINNENPKDNSGGYFIECPGCGASTSLRFACGDDPTSLLAEQWNRRATSHCLHQIQEPAAAEQAAWHAGLDEGRAQAAPAAVAVPDGIAAFEKLLDTSMAALTDRSSAKEHVQIWDDAHDALEAWKARGALAVTPAAVATDGLAKELADMLESTCNGLESYRNTGPWTDADEDHLIESRALLARVALLAPQLAIMPKGKSAAAQLRAMATNYPSGHSWDKLDAKAYIRGALEIEALRALLAGASAPAAPPASQRDELLQVALDFIGTLTGMSPPPIEVAPPEVFAPFYAFVDRVQAITAPQAQADARDAAFEAVRKKFCKLQRYSFFLDDKGNVRRTPDYCGNWVEFEAVHTLFEPGAVDAAIATQATQQGGDKQ